VAGTEASEEIHESLEDAEERLAEEQAQPYVRLGTPDLFAYLDFRNLREIIEAFWDDFKDCIPRKKVFLGMLEALDTIRNALATADRLPGKPSTSTRGAGQRENARLQG
jgi:hypothetical protein